MFPFPKDKSHKKEAKDLKKSVSLLPTVIFAVALVIALPLRMLQYKNNIEAGTGFYLSVDAAVIAFYAILAVAFAAIFVMAIKDRKNMILDRTAKRSIVIGAVTLVSAILCVYGGISDFLTPVSTEAPVYTVTTTSAALLVSLNKSAAVCEILSGIYFALSGAMFISGKGCGEIFKLLSLFPAIWSAIRLVARFTRTVSYIRVSDLFLEMLMLACFALFFMAYAQNNSKVNGEGTESKLMLFGLFGALLGFIVAVPRLVLVITGSENLMYELSAFEIGDLALALFSVAAVAGRIIKKEKSEA